MTTMTLDARVLPAARPVRTATPARTSTVRLTRRGRLVVFGAGLMTALALGLGLAANSTATERPEDLATITVGSGETLWSIASSVAVDGHTGDMVEQIKQLNHLSGGALEAGQTLRVPR
ncbi:LysM peptidoglycan-binding domain-containing protein [Nocardioides sp. Kera G14]|uniref:LysM peptidoglycan-binding domain-containing protein n=1 Tax=Nocardioides sp. Kera G14 TaxID=2884264 RepID=UPI001D113E74|nr:LysM peptidoglycan-binding domain-containing protein [Nocardioides sp. Kera G14]UDY24150.1 LysM peptidoglycan-binding domain-containing protein [Nocardioides sp. Kera G14]